MARRRRGRRGRRSKTIPMAVLAPPAMLVVGEIQANGLTRAALEHIVAHTTGFYQGAFNVAHAKNYWLAQAGGIIVHKVASKVGVNRYLRKATFGYLEL